MLWNKQVGVFRKGIIENTSFNHQCQGKKKVMKLKDLVEHLKFDCPQNKIWPCVKCDSKKKYTIQKLIEHVQQDCEKAELECQRCSVPTLR